MYKWWNLFCKQPLTCCCISMFGIGLKMSWHSSLSMECECASFYSNQTQNSSWFKDQWHSCPFLPFTFVVAWEGELPCTKWDCECAFKRQRGCCCATPELKEVEDQIFERVMDLSMSMSQLGDSVLEVIGTQESPYSCDYRCWLKYCCCSESII